MKTSGSSNDNKKEFFKHLSMFEKFKLIPRSCYLNTIDLFFE